MLEAFIIGLIFIALLTVHLVMLPITIPLMIWHKIKSPKKENKPRGINFPPLTLG